MNDNAQGLTLKEYLQSDRGWKDDSFNSQGGVILDVIHGTSYPALSPCNYTHPNFISKLTDFFGLSKGNTKGEQVGLIPLMNLIENIQFSENFVSKRHYFDDLMKTEEFKKMTNSEKESAAIYIADTKAEGRTYTTDLDDVTELFVNLNSDNTLFESGCWMKLTDFDLSYTADPYPFIKVEKDQESWCLAIDVLMQAEDIMISGDLT